MTIGIYGDSFAISHLQSRHFAWYNLLAEKLNTIVYNHENNEIQTYGLGASSTFYAYKKFIKYHHLHEYNIFIASYAQKYPKLVNLTKEEDHLIPISGINSLEWYIDDPNITADGKELLERIKSWFLVNDEEYMITAQELMLQDMERRCGKNVIILCSNVEESFCQERKEKSCVNFGLWDLANLMYKEIGINHSNRVHTLNEKQDKISCHMTETTNHVLADMIYNHIKTGEKMIMPESIPHNHTWEHYYI